MRDIHYDFPQAVYLLLLLIPLLFLYGWLFYYRQQSTKAYASSSILPQLLKRRSFFFSILKAFALSFAWILACIAFMGPKGNLQYQLISHANQKRNIHTQTQAHSQLPHQTHEVIFLIDASASMSVSDARHHRTRLIAAKEIVEQIISQLIGQTIALDAFTSELTPLVPPTLDYLFVRLVLQQLGINEGDVGGTDLAKVLETLKEKILSTPFSKLYTIILLSDGGDNRIEKLQGQAKEEAIQKVLHIIPNPTELNLRIFTIGMGSKEGGTVPSVTFNGQPIHSRLEEEILKSLAHQERGTYYEANAWPAWNLAQDLINQMKENSPDAEGGESAAVLERKVVPAKQEEISYDFYYQLPLGLAILFLLLYFILPDVHRV